MCELRVLPAILPLRAQSVLYRTYVYVNGVCVCVLQVESKSNQGSLQGARVAVLQEGKGLAV